MSEQVSKSDLRRVVRGRLLCSSVEERRLWSDSICANLEAFILEHIDCQGVVGVFSPMAVEPDISAWSLELMGKRSVCFPRMAEDSGSGVMRFFKVGGMGDLLLEPRFGGRWMEPSLTCEEVSPEQLSVILVPFVALDSSGSRLGHGGGFYDRYLVQLRPEVMRVAVGFEIQLVPEVPAEWHDVKMDALVTEAGVRRFARV